MTNFRMVDSTTIVVLEKEINGSWLAGFIDGEGCFYVGINASRSCSVGFQVLPEFRLVQHGRDALLLRRISSFLNCGNVVSNRGRSSGSQILELRIRNFSDLKNKLVPFLEQYPLLSTKAEDFDKFKQVLVLVSTGQHLTLEGLSQIRLLKISMNRGRFT